jgi:predicted nucleic acid-binding Zn ribbon protein
VECESTIERIELTPQEDAPFCEGCGNRMVRVMLPSRASFSLKGEGWPGKTYVTTRGSEV